MKSIIVSFLLLPACKKEYSGESCLTEPVIIPYLPLLADRLLYCQLVIDGKYYETKAYKDNSKVGNAYHYLNDIDHGLAFSSAIVQPGTTTQPLSPFPPTASDAHYKSLYLFTTKIGSI